MENKSIRNYEEYSVEQQNAILETGKNILVSASAGTGKTTVMIERIIRLVCDENVDVKSLLVVTFTSAAATEMKQRLYAALKQEILKGGDKKKIKQQIEDIDLASICTIDSFCNDLLLKYFYLVPLNPNFKLLTGEDVQLLKNKAINNVMQRFDGANDTTFSELKECFVSKRRDGKLNKCVLDIYNYAMTLKDPTAFINDIMPSAFDNRQTIFKVLYSDIKQNINVVKKTIESVVADIASNEVFEKCLMSLNERLVHLISMDSKKTLEELLSFFDKADFSCLNKLQLPNKIEKTEQILLLKAKCDKAKTEFDNLVKRVKTYAMCMVENNMDAYKKTLAYICKLKDLVTLFKDEYKRLKDIDFYVDFQDVEQYAMQVLSSKDVSLDMRSRYKHVFIDEYQDVNEVQETIFSSISNGKNMFMVGDVKQSIYAFRACDPTIFTEKYKLFKLNNMDAAIEFKNNFRSNKKVLDFVNHILGAVMTDEFGGVDYNKTSKFNAKAVIPDDGVLPTVGVTIVSTSKDKRDDDNQNLKDEEQTNSLKPYYDVLFKEEVAISDEILNVEVEAEAICDKLIKHMNGNIYDTKQKRIRKVTFKDFALLVRGYNSKTLKIIEILKEKGFPVLANGKTIIGAEIKILFDLLKVCLNFKNDIPLVAVLLSPFGGFTCSELAMTRLAYNKIDENNYKNNFYLACECNQKLDVSLEIKNKFEAFFKMLDELRTGIQINGVAIELLKIITKKNYDAYALASFGEVGLLKVNSFINSISKSLFNFSLQKYLENIDENSLDLGDVSIVTADAINVMTIHKSKGLEFPIVFLINCGGKFNITDNKDIVSKDKNFGVAMHNYDVLARAKTNSLIKLSFEKILAKHAIEEEIRILYVALTRAKNKLEIFGQADMNKWNGYTDNYSMTNCLCYLDIMSKAFVEDKIFGENIKDDLLYDFNVVDKSIMQSKTKDELNYVVAHEHDVKLENAISQFIDYTPYIVSEESGDNISVTKIVYGEKYKNLLGNETLKEDDDSYIIKIEEANDVDFAENKAALLGTDYHKIFEYLSYNEKCNVKNVVKLLESKGELNLPNEIDISLVEAYTNSELVQSFKNRKLYHEQPFFVSLDNSEAKRFLGQDKVVSISGKIDLLVEGENGVVIVDFKTKSIKSVEEATALYGKQLEIYKLAVEKVLKRKVLDVVIYSINAKKAFYL